MARGSVFGLKFTFAVNPHRTPAAINQQNLRKNQRFLSGTIHALLKIDPTVPTATGQLELKTPNLAKNSPAQTKLAVNHAIAYESARARKRLWRTCRRKLKTLLQTWRTARMFETKPVWRNGRRTGLKILGP